MESYRLGALRKRKDTELRRAIRLKRGWEVASRAATLLGEKFRVRKVVVFGSLLRPEQFGDRSDVDLAVWGLADDDFLRAVAAVTSLDGEISVDLIAAEQAPPGLLRHIENEGREI